jgi:pimeloyl-ACP methyl ester carboxylesterase
MLKKRAFADLPNGLQIYYETMGEGDPVIFLHQSWWNNFEYQKVLPKVAQKFKVYSPDTLGFGCSPSAPWDWRFEDFAQSFIDMMDFLKIEKASFVGMHTGSVLAAEIAAKHPERVDKLVLYGLCIFQEELRKEKYARRRMLGAQGPYRNQLQPGDVIGKEASIVSILDDGAHLVEMWQEQKRENPDSKLEHVQKAFIANLIHYDKGGADIITELFDYDLEAILPKVKASALLLMGSKDCVKEPVLKPIPYAGSLMSGPVKYKIIYGAGIAAWIDYPDECAEATMEYLSNPEGYIGSAEREVKLAEREYLFLVEEDIPKFIE